jgi:hypothetical protein
MTAPNVIAFPVIPRPQISVDLGEHHETALPPLRIPRKSYGRLLRFAKEWDVDVGTAAEMLLLAMLNEKKSK